MILFYVSDNLIFTLFIYYSEYLMIEFIEKWFFIEKETDM